MNEFELIQRYLVQPNPPESVRVGNGDDCAVFAVNPGYELCISIDATIAGRHVPLVTPGALFAERALRRALSDLAACGATPKYLLISLTSDDFEPTWIGHFGETVHRFCADWQMTLLGGDLSRGPTAAHITVLGEVPAGQAIRRGGARAGDQIVFFGPDCGGARAYLEVLAGHQDVALWQARYWYPEPQIRCGLQLCGQATACIDVSDGLLQDLQHLLEAASEPLRAALSGAHVPLCAGLVEAFGRDQALQMALTGGDDYGLLATLPDQHPMIAQGHWLGQLTSADSPHIELDGELLSGPEWAGWDHSR